MQLLFNIRSFNYPDQIKITLNKIKQYDFYGYDFKQITLLIRKYLEALPVIVNTFKSGNYLARARTKENDIPYNRFSKITLPIKKLVKSYGRANIPGQTVFYCSSDYETAIKEATQWHITDAGTLISRKMLDQNYNPHVKFVTVSIWRAIKDLKVASLFLNKEAMQSNPIVNYFGNKVYSENPNLRNDKVKESINLILEFFSNEFGKKDIKNEKDYILSAYYANEIYNMYKLNQKIDGILYPSIAYDYKGENFALVEEAYKEKLEFVTAFHNIVYNLEHNGKPLQIGEISQVYNQVGDVFTWKDLPIGEILPIDESE